MSTCKEEVRCWNFEAEQLVTYYNPVETYQGSSAPSLKIATTRAQIQMSFLDSNHFVRAAQHNGVLPRARTLTPELNYTLNNSAAVFPSVVLAVPTIVATLTYICPSLSQHLATVIIHEHSTTSRREAELSRTTAVV